MLNKVNVGNVAMRIRPSLSNSSLPKPVLTSSGFCLEKVATPLYPFRSAGFQKVWYPGMFLIRI